jgi:hypothetical protein
MLVSLRLRIWLDKGEGPGRVLQAGSKIADRYAFEVVIRNRFQADFGALPADIPRRRPACERVADRTSGVVEHRSAS